MGKPGEAALCYRRAVARDPKHKGAWNNLAQSLFESEQYLEASDAFFKCYELSQRKAAKLLYYSSLTLLVAQRYGDFLARFEKLFEAHPAEIELVWKENYVYGLLHADLPKKAIPFMVELAREFRGKKQRHWREILLQQYMALEMHAEAEAFLQRLTRLEPTEALWWKGLAHLYLQVGKHRKALAALTIYSFLSPLSDEERTLIADLYLQEGIPAKAAFHYEKRAEKEPDRELLLRLSRSYLELDQPDKALQALARIEEKERDGDVEMTRGNIFYSMKQYDPAAASFEKAAAANGNKGHRAHLMAGYSYWHLGRYQTAKEMFAKAAAGKDLEKEALKAIEQLERAAVPERSG